MVEIKIKAINTWAESLMRYGVRFIGWTKQELQKMDRKISKVLIMNKQLVQKLTQLGLMCHGREVEEVSSVARMV